MGRIRVCCHPFLEEICMRWLPVLLLLALPAWGQDVVLLPCGTVAFFDEPCPAPDQATVALAPSPPPAVPLFEPATMAPDTPKLMVNLLQNPTVENAGKFLDWQTQRQARIQEVQQLLQTLTRARSLP
jgi:hypothetical protein